MADIYADLAAIRGRYRSRRAWRKRRVAIVRAVKFAGVAALCLAAMPLAVALGAVIGAGLAP